MKKLMLVLIAVLLGFPAQAQSPEEKALERYLQVKAALIDGDAATARTAATQLAGAVSTLSHGKQLGKAAQKLSRQESLEEQRKTFATLSTLAWAAVKASGPMQVPLYYHYCPMQKSYWISMEEEVRNPYYGASMLDCGRVAEKLEAK